MKTGPLGGGNLPIPQDGLDEVLSAWSGRGELLDALALVEDDMGVERRWSRVDVLRRAQRVLFSLVEPVVSAWPTSVRTWLDALPAESMHVRALAVTPTSGTSWPETRRRFGWPPTAFSLRARSRVADSLLVTTLRWTLEALLEVHEGASLIEPTIGRDVRRQLDAARELLQWEPVAGAQGQVPGLLELNAVRREGFPWNVVARAAEHLIAQEGSLEELARRLIMPDEELRGRLFHLAVLGVLLVALKGAGVQIVSRRPLSATTLGPAYVVRDKAGLGWDLWFEAAGMWSYYGVASPYLKTTSRLEGFRRPLSPDIVLLRRNEASLILECKYSRAPAYVSSGVAQVIVYSTEVTTALAQVVRSVVIVPEGVVDQKAETETVAGSIGLARPSDLAAMVQGLVGA
jgi:hypothetical protein